VSYVSEIFSLLFITGKLQGLFVVFLFYPHPYSFFILLFSIMKNINLLMVFVASPLIFSRTAYKWYVSKHNDNSEADVDMADIKESMKIYGNEDPDGILIRDSILNHIHLTCSRLIQFC